jgi:hypothetical protein
MESQVCTSVIELAAYSCTVICMEKKISKKRYGKTWTKNTRKSLFVSS